MSESREARLRVSADAGAAALVNGFVEKFGAERRIAKDDMARILVAVEELVTNIVKYGYPPPARAGFAEITLRLAGDELTAEIVDDACPFDPESAPAPDFEAPIEKQRAGGLGLHLVKALMHRMRYRRDGDRNVVEIARRVVLDP